MKKIILIFVSIICLLIVLFIIFVVWSAVRERKIAGYVYDCETNLPIENADISANQSLMFWNYYYRAKTDLYGNFSLSYKINNTAAVEATKAGYLNSRKFGLENSKIQIGMLKLKSGESFGISYGCKREEECTKQENINGVITVTNTCEGW